MGSRGRKGGKVEDMGDAAREKASKTRVELIGRLEAVVKGAAEEVHVGSTIREEAITSVSVG